MRRSFVLEVVPNYGKRFGDYQKQHLQVLEYLETQLFSSFKFAVCVDLFDVACRLAREEKKFY